MVAAVDDADRFHSDFPYTGGGVGESKENEFGSSFFYNKAIVDRNFCPLVQKFKIGTGVDTDRNPCCSFTGRGSQGD